MTQIYTAGDFAQIAGEDRAAASKEAPAAATLRGQPASLPFTSRRDDGYVSDALDSELMSLDGGGLDGGLRDYDGRGTPAADANRLSTCRTKNTSGPSTRGGRRTYCRMKSTGPAAYGMWHTITPESSVVVRAQKFRVLQAAVSG